MEVRACQSMEEMCAAFGPIWHYFGRLQPSVDQIKHFARVMDPSRALAGFDGESIVAGAASFPFDLTVPGGQVRAAGVTVVGALPTHRRQGYLGAMMRALIDGARTREEPVAVLWATEDTIYGRFGYGMASMAAEIDVLREHTAPFGRLDVAARTRLVPLGEAEPLIAPDLRARRASDEPGMFVRTPAWWQDRVLTDPDWRRGNSGFLRCAVLEIGGKPSAYAFYRVHQMFERGNSSGSVFVVEAMGDTPAATQAIWRFLFDMDWLARLKAIYLPLDHPMLLSLKNPRRLNFLVREGLWVRLIDLPAALSARGYATDDAIVIEVTDPFCRWNTGRWRIARRQRRTHAGGGRSRLRRRLARVRLSRRVQLRGTPARALRVTQLREGALARADAMFHSDRKPWCPELF